MSARQSFSKADRLKSYKRIRLLFSGGERFRQSPLVVHYRFRREQAGPEGGGTSMATKVLDGAVLLQAGVSVPSRFFKKAVQRNLLKRRMREAYRKQKEPLTVKLQSLQLSLDLFLVFIENKVATYDEIYASVERSIEKLINLAEAQQHTDGNE